MDEDDNPRPYAPASSADDVPDASGLESQSAKLVERLATIAEADKMDKKYGFERRDDGETVNAWLLNMNVEEVMDEEKRLVSAVAYFFVQDSGERFKVSLPFQPYFYVAARDGCETEVMAYLSKKFEKSCSAVELLSKEDLDLDNHLTGLKRTYIKLSFVNTLDLATVKKALHGKIIRNIDGESKKSEYEKLLEKHLTTGAQEQENRFGARKNGGLESAVDNMIDIREHDVPYHVRVSIDNKIFVGLWYSVVANKHTPTIVRNMDLVDPPEPVVLAFDIETTKLPLKFPDATFDQVMMISYMIDGRGFLITNRQVVSADVDDFEYTPKPEYEGKFTVWNEADEKALLLRFFEHVLIVRPNIFVTYNGDFFDWPFIETRAKFHSIDMTAEIGFAKDKEDEYKSRQCSHMDAYRWVKRDSYLPMGSQNLKATTKAKLRYDPVELDPEEMCRMAREQPQVLATYSVSDAVATYYLYMKYVQPFIFALCTIIPMTPDEVLRKGSGTLCEALLMVEAFHAHIIFPNKKIASLRPTTEDGHLIDVETYVGGHVEALESGVFRANIPTRFRLVPSALQDLIDTCEKTLAHEIEHEIGVPLHKVTNFKETVEAVRAQLAEMRDQPSRLEHPIIYHLDVAAMYPNIILTNRLQPPAIISESTCASCSFNRTGATCQRKMEWMWRGDVVPASRGEYARIVQQLENEKFPPKYPNQPQRAYHQLAKDERAQVEKKRVMDYCKKAYRKGKETKMELRTTTVCQRENSFYVDTVRAFRDRRYEYKGLLKTWKRKLAEATESGDALEAKSCRSKEVLYDSLQLAHKCILNSFYGYVMRKGSRWFSMEMAGIVCHTGANIIKKARELIEQIGRPLELDTDGIWCMLPASFPENLTMHTSDPKKPKVTVSYPGAMLNMLVKESFTNHQYHDLTDAHKHKYEVHSENSIFFEVDGPYLAMVLPAAKEEGKKLKKRYAVFNHDHTLAELKGFEVKRRGELQLIKIFQSSVFDAFLDGDDLKECYASVAKVADYWLDVLYSKGVDLPDSELFALISENRSMSKKLEDYGSQKSTSIATARRLAEFLGDQMVRDAGLACRFIISRLPSGAPVTERAIPTAIFSAEPNVMRYYLKKWLRTPQAETFDIRDILDWEYYKERLGSTIQKIITIPAALQGVTNPVPRVVHPDWLHRKLLEKTDAAKQPRITDMFAPLPKRPPPVTTDVDMEDVVKKKTTLPPRSAMRNAEIDAQQQRSTAKSPPVVDAAVPLNWRRALGPPPRFGATYKSQTEWLAYHKKKWRMQREVRRDAQTAERRAKIGNVDRSMQSFMKTSANALHTRAWHVIQMVASGEPGVYTLWALLHDSNELHRVRVRVPRVFYVNTRQAKESDVGECYRRVQRTLPRNNVVHNLYEYKVPEAAFKQRINEINNELYTPHIEGIYETHVPLEFRALAHVGAVCRLTNSKVLKDACLPIDALTLCTPLDGFSYLAETSASIRHLYLYQYAQDTRQTWALFEPSTGRATVFLLDKRRPENVPNMSTMYAKDWTKKNDTDPNSVLPKESHSFDVHPVATLKEVYAGIQKQLRSIQAARHGATMLVVHSVMRCEEMCRHISAMNDMPCVKLPLPNESNLYTTMNWTRVALTRTIFHYLNSVMYIDHVVSMARYYHVPVGNLTSSSDVMVWAADLRYARALWQHNHVIWASPSGRPDLGGKQMDDSRLLGDWHELGKSGQQLINEPCMARACVVDVSVGALAVAALIHHSQLDDAPGTAFGTQLLTVEQMVAGQQTTVSTCTDDSVRVSAAIRVLRQIVFDAIKDVRKYRNRFADELLVQFYRWTITNDSLMYEPAVKKALHALMHKLCLLMVAELKRLGANVIHATYTRLIIDTGKHSVADAQAYIGFVLQHLHTKPIFASIDMKAVRIWHNMLWMDAHNYAGVRYVKGNDKVPPSNEDDEEECVPPPDGQVDAHWTLGTFLPNSRSSANAAIDCEEQFDMVLGGYVQCLYQKMNEILARPEEEEEEEMDGDHTMIHSQVAGDEEECADEFDEEEKENRQRRGGVVCKDAQLAELSAYARSVVAGDMTQRLLEIVNMVHSKMGTGNRHRLNALNTTERNTNTSVFPHLPGSHLTMTSPALQFVKYITHILSLHASIQSTVINLKRNLLRLLVVSEFADAADFVDPCLSFVLVEVACRKCGWMRDVDVCRDVNVDEENGTVLPYLCTRCNHEYNIAQIEHLLLDALQRTNMAAQMQDCRCVKCHMIKQWNMSSMCECTGEFVNNIQPSQLKTRYTVFHNIASLFDMPLLKEATETLLDVKTV